MLCKFCAVKSCNRFLNTRMHTIAVNRKRPKLHAAFDWHDPCSSEGS
jgi:hypothetical protein